MSWEVKQLNNSHVRHLIITTPMVKFDFSSCYASGHIKRNNIDALLLEGGGGHRTIYFWILSSYIEVYQNGNNNTIITLPIPSFHAFKKYVLSLPIVDENHLTNIPPAFFSMEDYINIERISKYYKLPCDIAQVIHSF